MHTHFKQFFDRPFRPCYVTLIVHVDVLPQLGWIGKYVATEFKDYRGFGPPRMIIELGTLNECPKHSQPGDSQTCNDDHKTEQTVLPREGSCGSSIGKYPGVTRMVDPLPGADVRERQSPDGKLQIDIVEKELAARVARGGSPLAAGIERGYGLKRAGRKP